MLSYGCNLNQYSEIDMKDQATIIKMIDKYATMQAKTVDAKLTEKHEATLSVLNWAKDKELTDVIHWIVKLEQRRDPDELVFLSDEREAQLRVLYWVADIDDLELRIVKLRRSADTVVKHSATAYANTIIFGRNFVKRVKEMLKKPEKEIEV